MRTITYAQIYEIIATLCMTEEIEEPEELMEFLEKNNGSVTFID